jgi:hypothetical protein
VRALFRSKIKTVGWHPLPNRISARPEGGLGGTGQGWKNRGTGLKLQILEAFGLPMP